MKVIVSHDVDHFTVTEHKSDLIIPKLLVRSSLEVLAGSIDQKEFRGRCAMLLKNRLHNLEELLDFDTAMQVRSTFFVAVNQGLGLKYCQDEAEKWVKKILAAGFDVGVHGIVHDDYQKMAREYRTFKAISGLSDFGIRMHYLRRSSHMLKHLSDAGYLYDSTFLERAAPFKTGNLWEFPLHLMDSRIFYQGRRWQNRSFLQAKEETKRTLEEVFEAGIPFFTVLFHDNYFSDHFATMKKWYLWFVQYVKDNRLPFVGYRQALQEVGGE